MEGTADVKERKIRRSPSVLVFKPADKRSSGNGSPNGVVVSRWRRFRDNRTFFTFAGASHGGRTGQLVTGPAIAARPYHRSRSVLPHDPSRNGSSIRARSQSAQARTRRDRSRPLRRAQDTLGENLLFLAPRTFRRARESGTSGQSRRRACQRGAARAP